MGALFLLLAWSVGIFLTRHILHLKHLKLWTVGWISGFILSTWLAYAFSHLAHALGSQTPISTSTYATFTTLLLAQAFWRKTPWRDLSLSKEQILWVFGTLFISAFLMFSTFHLETSTQKLVMDRLVFSDFANHIPLIRSFSMGENIPVESPLFAGVSIRYHFMFYFFVGYLENLGLSIDWGLNLTSTLGFATFLIAIPFLLKTLFPQNISQKSGVLAVFLTLCSGSLAFFHTLSLSSFSLASLWKGSLGRVSFLSGGPYYNWDEVITGLFWTLSVFTNQRHFAFGIAVGLVFLVFVLRPKNLDTKQSIFLGILWGLFPLFHGLSFVSFTIVMVGFLVFQKPRKPLALLMGIAAIIALPQMLSLSPSSPSAAPSFRLGYALFPHLSVLSFFNYWIQNIGLKFLLLPILLFWWKGQRRLLLILSLSIFVLPNLVKFGPDIYTNHKFFNIWLVILNLFTAQWLVEFWNQKIWRKILVVCTTVLISISGFLDLFPILHDGVIKIHDWKADVMARKVMQHSKPQDVFVTSYAIYHPVNLVGRKVLLGWPYFLWSSGYPDGLRMRKVKAILETRTPDIRCRLLHKLGARYLVIGKNPRYSEPYDPALEILKSEMHLVAEDSRYYLLDSSSFCKRF